MTDETNDVAVEAPVTAEDLEAIAAEVATPEATEEAVAEATEEVAAVEATPATE